MKNLLVVLSFFSSLCIRLAHAEVAEPPVHIYSCGYEVTTLYYSEGFPVTLTSGGGFVVDPLAAFPGAHFMTKDTASSVESYTASDRLDQFGNVLDVRVSVNSNNELITQAVIKNVGPTRSVVVMTGQAFARHFTDVNEAPITSRVVLENPVITNIRLSDPTAPSAVESALFPREQVVIADVTVGCTADVRY